MNRLAIKNNSLCLKNNKPIVIDELFTNEFYELSNIIAEDFNNNHFVVNELYIQIIQPVIALKKYIQDNQVSAIEIHCSDCDIYPFIIDIATDNKIPLKQKGKILDKPQKSISYFEILLSGIYLIWLMLKIPFKQDNETTIINDFSITRTVAAEKKIKALGIPYEIENPKLKTSIYRLTPRRTRLMWVCKSIIKSFNEINKYAQFIKLKIGANTASKVYSIYGKRIVHTLLYYNMLDNYFSKKRGLKFYTGNNLDRFSVIEDELAAKHGIQSICIPHGLEYGFKFPKGFSCNTFYTTSNLAAIHLNALYNTTKFQFDANIATNIFKVTNKNQKRESKIIFFSEPREITVNQTILKELLPLLKTINVVLTIKLHPKDNKSNYSDFDVEYIEDSSDALTENICFARKSTMLLEAVYNESKVAAIITNEKDAAIFYSFPSLQTSKIEIKKSVSELFQWINNEYNKLKE